MDERDLLVNKIEDNIATALFALKGETDNEK